MEDRTAELLKKCKEAGYETVAIFISDPRVPESEKYEKTANTRSDEGRLSPLCWFGNWSSYKDENEEVQYVIEPHLVCCHPPRTDREGKGAEGGMLARWPSIWRIGKEMSIRTGGAYGDTIKIRSSLMESLTAGFYDLGEVS